MPTRHGFGFLHHDHYPVGFHNIRLWDLGVTWKDVNPQKDLFNWTRLDFFVDLAERNGATDILYVLGMTPQWAAKDPNADHYAPWIGPGSNSAPRNIDDWDKYVWNVARRYKGRIKYYQIWNEPQLKDFWSDYSDIDFLGQMTRRAKKVINNVDPQAKVVAAPILPRPSSGGVKRGSKYLQVLQKYGWPVDVFSCHVYPEPKMGPLRWRRLVMNVKEALTAFDAPNHPLWVTETNYNLLHGPYRSKRKVRRYLQKTNTYANKLGVDRVYWYAYGVHSNPNVFGIRFITESAGYKKLREFLW